MNDVSEQRMTDAFSAIGKAETRTSDLPALLRATRDAIRALANRLEEVQNERDELRGSRDNAAYLKEHSDLLREVARDVSAEAGLGVLDLKSAPFMVRQLIERNQNQVKMVKDAHQRELEALEDRDRLKAELEKERSKNVGYVYVTEPEGIARAQGRKLERERIMRLIKDRQGAHMHHSLRCDACTEDEALFSLLEKGE